VAEHEILPAVAHPDIISMSYVRPLWPGSSVGPKGEMNQTGTLGFVILAKNKKTGEVRYFGLTCHHVFTCKYFFPVTPI
jgi:hypothetical protein